MTLIAPHFTPFVIPATLAIMFGLFGPFMAGWFLLLAVKGLSHILDDRLVLAAFAPLHGLWCLFNHGAAALPVLGSVALAITGVFLVAHQAVQMGLLPRVEVGLLIANLTRLLDGDDLPISVAGLLAVSMLARVRVTRVTITFGYMASANVPLALAQARNKGIRCGIMATSFFLNRRAFRLSDKKNLPQWHERPSVTLTRTASAARDQDHLPSNRITGLDQQITVWPYSAATAPGLFGWLVQLA